MSSSKVFLTSKNSVWGIINNPVSDNVYRHVLSFDNETLKEKFINDNLIKFDIRTGPGEGIKTKVSYLDILDNYSPSVQMTAVNSFTSTFQIHPKATYEYIKQQVRNAGDEVIAIESPTYDDLLNKDYAIIKENDKVKFYSLTATRVRQWIQYTAELDIFMTYDIKNMFNTNKTRIERGVLDRFYKDGVDLKPIYRNVGNVPDKRQVDIPFLNSENIDENMKDVAQVWNKPNEIRFHFTESMFSFHASDHFTVEDKTLFTFILNYQLDWLTYYLSEFNHASFKGVKIGGCELPYMPLLSFTDLVNFKIFIELADGSSVQLTSGFPLGITKAATSGVSGLSLSFLLLSPWNQIFKMTPLKDGTLKWKVFKRASGQFVLTIPIASLRTTSFNVDKITYFNKNYRYISLFLYPPGSGLSNDVLYEFDLQRTPKITKNDFLALPNHGSNKYELKASLYPYKYYKVVGLSNSLIVQPQYLDNDVISFTGANSLDIMSNGYWLRVNNYTRNKATQNFGDNTDNTETLVVYSNYALPTLSVPYANYMVRNKYQIDHTQNKIAWEKEKREITNTATVIGGAIATVAGATTANGAAIGGGIGAIIKGTIDQVFTVADAEMSIKGIAAKMIDVRNTPAELNVSQNSLITDIGRTTINPYLISYKISKNLDIKVREYFYMYGYNLENRLHNINNYLKNRFFFNYIKAPETFENIRLQLSTQIKQMIDVSLKQGITVWHIRTKDNDHTDYVKNQVKNYEVENWEMVIYED